MSTAVERCEGRGVKGDGVRGSGAQRVGGLDLGKRSVATRMVWTRERSGKRQVNAVNASVSDSGSEHGDAWKAGE
jgi:hypothetical protein